MTRAWNPETSCLSGRDGADVRSWKPTQVTGGAWKQSRVCQKRIKIASGSTSAGGNVSGAENKGLVKNQYENVSALPWFVQVRNYFPVILAEDGALLSSKRELGALDSGAMGADACEGTRLTTEIKWTCWMLKLASYTSFSLRTKNSVGFWMTFLLGILGQHNRIYSELAVQSLTPTQ